ncbi:sigma-70 family RNA polymerase sigma factor [Rubrivivax albus]|uniref:Sigma-70 family RNA polymerase sigma factor n=2 Tax=Rubrivivax albus TaxID=2499835 RepID=A0A437JRV1_9BURK|nr:sigma-70 family RNA polymerase sigma factor [Rubrivivax albus]
MLRFARLQLRDAAAAEDVVQEAIEAAWRQSTSFAGQSSLKTWVFAILRHRIVDHIRRDQRTVSFSALLDAEDEADWQQGLDQLFQRSGQWQPMHRPAEWPDPEAAMAHRQFWQALEQCLQLLPAATGKVFMMRELLGFEVAEICARLDISSGNCHVILHRARMKLRSCIQPVAAHAGDAAC